MLPHHKGPHDAAPSSLMYLVPLPHSWQKLPSMFLETGGAAKFVVKVMSAVKDQSDAAKLAELMQAASFNVTTLAQEGEDVAKLLEDAGVSA